MVVRMRHTHSQTANRRSHHALKEVHFSKCAHCGAPHLPHQMCKSCGYYHGRQVADVGASRLKRETRIREKARARGEEVSKVSAEKAEEKK